MIFYRIMHLLENGLIEKLNAQYLGGSKDASCGDEIKGESRPLTFDDIWASFLVLPAGLGIALLVLLWERTGIHGKSISRQSKINNRSPKTTKETDTSVCHWEDEMHNSTNVMTLSAKAMPPQMEFQTNGSEAHSDSDGTVMTNVTFV